jgi:hypothetical protein
MFAADGSTDTEGVYRRAASRAHRYRSTAVQIKVRAVCADGSLKHSRAHVFEQFAFMVCVTVVAPCCEMVTVTDCVHGET